MMLTRSLLTFVPILSLVSNVVAADGATYWGDDFPSTCEIACASFDTLAATCSESTTVAAGLACILLAAGPTSTSGALVEQTGVEFSDKCSLALTFSGADSSTNASLAALASSFAVSSTTSVVASSQTTLVAAATTASASRFSTLTVAAPTTATTRTSTGSAASGTASVSGASTMRKGSAFAGVVGLIVVVSVF